MAAFALHFDATGAAQAQENQPQQAQPPPFSHEWLVEEARRRAAEPYPEPAADLPDGLGEISYDQYRDIRFKAEARIWADDPTEFKLDLLHRGFIYKDRVAINVVDGGASTRIPFSASLFEYGPLVTAPASGEGMDFSGFRVRNAVNTPDVLDEFAVFQGATYFRAVGRHQIYGMSARALSINTAEPQGEEFPAFREFWIERPAPAAEILTVHALLDSPSTTGAYRFAIAPGTETVIDVEGTIFPREDIEKVGIAPLTSMFMFDSTNHGVFDDFRRAVHDSDGLQMLTGAGEWLWRPLANPRELQISTFMDRAPRGFGLIQRARRYEDFEDLEASYERRPSVWIEPSADWGEGFVELVEIPARAEIHDNIVVYWRPNGPVPAGGPWRFGYRMRWTDQIFPRAGLLVTKASLMGVASDPNRRLFVIDFAAAEEMTPQAVTMEVSASTGQIFNPVVHRRQPDDTIRVSFELEPDSDQLSELRLRLLTDGKPASETWLYRWTAR